MKSCNHLEQANLQADTIYFLMCKSCYWSASYLTNIDKHIAICPVCGSNKMECLPILDFERTALDMIEENLELRLRGASSEQALHKYFNPLL
jgi:hypothetical protein